MHVDDPKGDREAMDKEELRHPSLDLILPGGATAPASRYARPGGGARPTVRHSSTRKGGISATQTECITRLQSVDDSGEGDKRQTTSGMD